MGVQVAAERKLLAEDECRPVARSHNPAVQGLARRLRSRRARMRDKVRERRRIRRGKAEPRGAAVEPPSERGPAAKKQVFARALRRVNGRIERCRAEEKRARATASLHEAFERKRAAPVHRPSPGRTAGGGMRPEDSQEPTVRTEPRETGRVSRLVPDAQARRDA